MIIGPLPALTSMATTCCETSDQCWEKQKTKKGGFRSRTVHHPTQSENGSHQTTIKRAQACCASQIPCQLWRRVHVIVRRLFADFLTDGPTLSGIVHSFALHVQRNGESGEWWLSTEKEAIVVRSAPPDSADIGRACHFGLDRPQISATSLWKGCFERPTGPSTNNYSVGNHQETVDTNLVGIYRR